MASVIPGEISKIVTVLCFFVCKNGGDNPYLVYLLTHMWVKRRKYILYFWKKKKPISIFSQVKGGVKQ